MNPYVLQSHADQIQKWLDFVIWAAFGAYRLCMGTLHEHKSRQLAELRETYDGVLNILCHFVSKDNYTQNHSTRLHLCHSNVRRNAARAVGQMCPPRLAHDIGKLKSARFFTRHHVPTMSAVSRAHPAGGNVII